MSLIASTVERRAAIEFAKAGAERPEIVGRALEKISQDGEIMSAMFDILETQKIIVGEARITMLPAGGALLGELLAAGARNERVVATPPVVPK